MNLFALTLSAGLSLAAPPAPASASVPVETLVPAEPSAARPSSVLCDTDLTEPCRARFESDKAFESFINPVTNPVFAKDPRSSTWARALFVNNNFPGSHPFGGGNAQAYAMQVNIALSERLTIIADKDGYADFNPRRGGTTNGWLNLAAGLKYTFVRDVENQFLVAGGLMYEIPSGEASAFQGYGDGNITPFITWGKKYGDHVHFIGNVGYSAALNDAFNSSFVYTSLHLDREINGWLYPLVEFNWFPYTTGGNVLPRAIGEGDGLLNLGTQGMNGRQLFTTAVGAKVKFGEHLYAGAAYEIPLSDYKGIMNNRVTVDLVIRY